MKRLSLFFLFSVSAIVLFTCNNPKTNSINNKNTSKATNSSSTSNTLNNLKTAYRAEIEASAKCYAYSQKTRDEGIERLSVLFLAIAKAKSINAKNIRTEIENMGSKADSIVPEFTVNSTKENLNSIIKNETNNFMNIYPLFINKAKIENAINAEKTFTWLVQTEKNQTVLYVDALQAIDQNWTNAFYTLYYVCPTCGNVIYPQNAEDICTICSTDKKKFIPVG